MNLQPPPSSLPHARISRPKQVNRSAVFPLLDLPFDPEASPNVQPLWGRIVFMIIDGGCFKVTDNPSCLRGKNGAPRMPRPGEPEPHIASYASAIEICRAVWRAGGTRWQVEQLLGDPDHAGGALYRYQFTSGRKDPGQLLNGIWESLAETETNPYYRGQLVASDALDVSPQDSLSLVDGLFVIGLPTERPITKKDGRAKREKETYRDAPSPQHRQAIMDWLRQNPGASQQRVIDAHPGGVHPRVIRRHLAAMAEEGVLTTAKQPNPAGRGRPINVWSVVDPVGKVAEIKAERVERQRRSAIAADLVNSVQETARVLPTYNSRQYDKDVLSLIGALLGEIHRVAELDEAERAAWRAEVAERIAAELRPTQPVRPWTVEDLDALDIVFDTTPASQDQPERKDLAELMADFMASPKDQPVRAAPSEPVPAAPPEPEFTELDVWTRDLIADPIELYESQFPMREAANDDHPR